MLESGVKARFVESSAPWSLSHNTLKVSFMTLESSCLADLKGCLRFPGRCNEGSI